MELPDALEIPLIKLSPSALFSGMFTAAHVLFKQQRGIRKLSTYLNETPGWFQHMRTRLESTNSKAALLTIWEQEIAPHILQGVWCVLGSVTHSSDFALKLRRDLTKMVGPDDANILIANLSERDDLLASLGLVAGLAKLARGEITREAYLAQFGHRGPHEFELSVPPPAEDPQWLDEQLVHFRENPIDIDDLLAKQRDAFRATWERLLEQYPRQANAIHKRIRENARRARLRELGRSEYTRDRWLIRLFALRVAELTDLGEDVFFLRLDEVLALLSGDQDALAIISNRKMTYQQYKALPPYPSIIRGAFDPIKWAADPQHRNDVFDATTTHKTEISNLITGSPGSTGRVTGLVRVVDNPKEGQQLQAGEILVAVQTDVAWTLLFPRVSAVITDVGAPLSHAAIVARELGIPAVVGCGDATTRLQTGDRVRVDGARGTVEILKNH